MISARAFSIVFVLLPAAAQNVDLPVKRVVLFKNGVAYFEHVGRVRANQNVSIAFNSAQLDDVLKSLTVLDLNGGRITGITYGSTAPADRQLSELHLPAGKATMTELLGALRGVRIEVRRGPIVIAGKSLGVERKDRTSEGAIGQADFVSIMTDGGVVRTMELSPSVSIRLLDRELTSRVERALDLATEEHAPDLRRLTIGTAGSGDRSLFVGYISEAPVWKSTYRIVLSGKSDQTHLLQGWAVVDNTGNQDWTNVDLSLVAGAPHSFIQQLSRPYYSRRPVVEAPSSANIAPQTHQATLIATEPATAPGSAQALEMRPSTGLALAAPPALTTTGSGTGLGRGTGLGMRGFGPGSGGGVGGGVFAIRGGESPAVEPKELGDLFEYKLKEPITVRKNQSALVPIIHATIGGEKVSVWNEGRGWPRPQLGLWLANTSGLTLDGGSFSVLEANTFAGEGIFEPIRAGEKRLISYATDLGLNVSSRRDDDVRRIARVRIEKGMMTHETQVRETKKYTVRNEDTTSRIIVIEHPVRQGYKLLSEPKPLELTSSVMRFRLEVKPKQTAALTVEEAKPTKTEYALTNINSAQVALFIEQRAIQGDIEAALRDLLARQQAVADLASRKAGLVDEQQKIFDDQQRLRENIKALQEGPEAKALLHRYVTQLDQQEDKLHGLAAEIEKLEKERAAAEAALNLQIHRLSFDVTYPA